MSSKAHSIIFLNFLFVGTSWNQHTEYKWGLMVIMLQRINCILLFISVTLIWAKVAPMFLRAQTLDPKINLDCTEVDLFMIKSAETEVERCCCVLYSRCDVRPSGPLAVPPPGCCCFSRFLSGWVQITWSSATYLHASAKPLSSFNLFPPLVFLFRFSPESLICSASCCSVLLLGLLSFITVVRHFFS